MPVDQRTIDEVVDEAHPGRRIAAWRDASGWSAAELARRSGVDKASISRIEALETFGRDSTLAKLAVAFGRSYHELFGGGAKDLTPQQGLVDVAKNGDDDERRAMRVSQAARIDLGAAAAYDLRAGDLLILAPAAGAAPEPGTLVVATEFRRGGEGGAVRPGQLRVIAPGPDGRTWLWPLQGEGQPTAAEPLEAPWEIVEVAVEQRRKLGRSAT